MSTDGATTQQNDAPADATEEDPAPEDQGVIITAQPPRPEEDAEPCADDDAGQPDEAEDQGTLPTSSTPEEREGAR